MQHGQKKVYEGQKVRSDRSGLYDCGRLAITKGTDQNDQKIEEGPLKGHLIP